MSEDITVTILDLLNLSLGTPEIGAVNFNLLHRFLLELVKHLSLARKQIDITDDFSIQSALEETRMLSGTKSQSYLLAHSSLSEPADGKRLSEGKARDSFTTLDGGKRGSGGSEITSRGSVSAVEKIDTPASGMRGKQSIAETARRDEGESRKGQVMETTKSQEALQTKRRTGEIKNAENGIKSVDEKDAQDVKDVKQRSHDVKEDLKKRSPDGQENHKQYSPGTSEDPIQNSPVANDGQGQSSPDGKEDAKRSPDGKAQYKAESPLSRISPVYKSRTHSPQSVMNSVGGRSASSVTKESKRTSPSSSKTDVRKRSLMEMAIPGLCQLERKISILEAKFESLSAGPTNLELVQQARDLQGRDSSTTAAGDMWQAMNLVRRIEVAEGAIDGVTAMLDDINEQLKKMKENSLDGRIEELSNKLKTMESRCKSSDGLDGLQANLAEMEKKLKNIAYKTDLKPYLTVKKMNDIMDYKLQDYRQLSPTVPKSPKKTASSKLAIQAEAMETGSQPAQTATQRGQTPKSEVIHSNRPVQPEPNRQESIVKVATETAPSAGQTVEATTPSNAQTPADTTRKSSAKTLTEGPTSVDTPKPNDEQATTESATVNTEAAANSTTATTPISEIAESEQTDNDDAQYPDIESVAESPIAEVPVEDDERRGSITTKAFEELYLTMNDWCDFRDEASQKINGLEESLSNTVDKDALTSLKNDLDQIQSTLKDEMKKISEMSKNRPVQLVERVASREDLSQLESSVEERLQALSKSLQEMKHNFFQLCEMKETIGGIKESEDRMKYDIENVRNEVMKILKQVEELAAHGNFGRKHSFVAGDSEELHEIRSSLLEMKTEIDKHNTAMTRIVDDQNKKQLHLEALYGHVDQLENIKADRQQIDRDIEVKADRKELEKKVSQDKFNNSLSSLDQSVQDLVEKLVGHEATLKQAINHITSDVNSKLDKMDMDTVKNYFEGKLKDLDSKVQRKPNEDKSQAAGSRCMLLHPANCISCDRPVHLYREGTKLPSLPFNRPLPGGKSNRPYMTFDLSDVRQKMYDVQNPRGKDQIDSLGQAKVQNELLKLGAIKDGDDFPEVPNRPCGGNHTLTCPEKRTTIRVNKAYREDLHFIAQLSQKDLSIVDILGYDGHVYKGHVNQLPSIPEIPKNTMARRPTTGSGRPRTSSPI